MPDDQFRFDTVASEQCAEYVIQQLRAFNQTQRSPEQAGVSVPAQDPLHVFALNAAGAVVGGVVGTAHYVPKWLDLSVVWVAEPYRRHGLGRRLMALAEQEARRRGCWHVKLATSSYQAPVFYEKLGYVRYGMLEGCPPGVTAFYYRKDLP